MARKNAIFSHEKTKAIGKALDRIASFGYSPSQVFRDWVALTFHAFEKDDPAYLKIVHQYKNEGKQGEREIDYFVTALSNLMSYMSTTNNEAYGELFQNYASDAVKSQFFTPHHVSELMAKMVLDITNSESTEKEEEAKIEEKEDDDKPFVIADPTCGAGVMLVSAAKELSYEKANKALLIGSDIDITCVQMTALNMMFFNMNSVIIWGNPLTLDVYDVWVTERNPVWGGSLRKGDKELAYQFWGRRPEATAN